MEASSVEGERENMRGRLCCLKLGFRFMEEDCVVVFLFLGMGCTFSVVLDRERGGGSPRLNRPERTAL